VEFHYYWLFFDLYTYVTVDKKIYLETGGFPHEILGGRKKTLRNKLHNF